MRHPQAIEFANVFRSNRHVLHENRGNPYTERALRYWDEKLTAFRMQPGAVELMIGASAADIRLRQSVKLEA